jgi:pimeloyl-ACP methyl ester carboxylesterase
MHPLFSQAHARLLTPTCTGVGERSHLLGPHVDLEVHIEDMAQVLEYEDLSDIVLIAHSYGGMVGTGLADRLPGRIRQLIYVDAILPESGESALDLLPDGQRTGILQATREKGFGWLIPPAPLPTDTPPHDRELAARRRGPQPLGTFTTPLDLKGRAAEIPAAYIRCMDTGPVDSFALSAARARQRKGWQFHELAASHNPHITVADAFTELIFSIAAPHA